MADNDLEKIANAFKNSNSSTTKNKTASSKSGKSKKTSNSSNGKNYWGKNYYKNPDLNNKTSSAVNKKISSSVNKTLDNTISAGLNNVTTSSQSNVLQKQIKKLPVISKICIIILFIVGVALSIGICYLVCRNDQFEIIGKKNITLNVNDSYTDLGVKAVGFGFDMQNQVTIEVYKDGKKLVNGLEEIDTSKSCTYQIVYKLSNFRFRDAQIIRTINVITPVEEAPEESYNPDATEVNYIENEITKFNIILSI